MISDPVARGRASSHQIGGLAPQEGTAPPHRRIRVVLLMIKAAIMSLHQSVTSQCIRLHGGSFCVQLDGSQPPPRHAQFAHLVVGCLLSVTQSHQDFTHETMPSTWHTARAAIIAVVSHTGGRVRVGWEAGTVGDS